MNNPLCQINWEYVIAILSLLVSLVVSIGTIISTNRNAKKDRFIGVISANRIEWIQKLKVLVSEYSNLVTYYDTREFPQDLNEFIGKLHEKAAAIRLHLNFKGSADQEIVTLVEYINMAYEKMLVVKRLIPKSSEYTISAKLLDYYTRFYPEAYKEIFQSITEKYSIDTTSEESMLSSLLKIKEKGIEEIIEISNEIGRATDKDIKLSVKYLKSGEDLLLLLTQIYLKVEWDRVKFEATNGSADKFKFEDTYLIYKTYHIERLTNLCRTMKVDFVRIPDQRGSR